VQQKVIALLLDLAVEERCVERRRAAADAVWGVVLRSAHCRRR
jgi:hypothetical protein